MDVAPPTPGHSLDEVLAEVVEGDGDLHARVREVVIAVSEEHDLVVVGHVVVGDGYPCGTHHCVDEPVLAP